ncbi:MAG: aldo/keto reductase, partial [Solobacterium sp.]|nr:aldo/keto reductase [Solobacterium sp.]
MTVNKHLILPALAALLFSSGCASESAPEETEAPAAENTPVPVQTEETQTADMIYAYVNDHVLHIRPSGNSSSQAFIELLKDGDITVDMHDYGNFEKVGPLGTSLPRNDEEITTSPGDVILYQGDQITIYYDINTWSFTRLGKVRGLTQKELMEILGSGNAEITFSLVPPQEDNMNAEPVSQTVLLNSGYEMPVIGLGTWTLNDDEAENSVYHALKSGMRLIDTARYYGNETGVGKGLQKAMDEGIVTREEVFITSKVMPSDYDRAAAGIENSLHDLNVSYIDLMLIHQPGSNDEAVYKALEEAVRAGKVRSVGISNYYTKEAVDE